jgi:sugar phosphate isomerase/epimerase
MTKRKTIIAINTLAFHGYSLDRALEEIARLADYVEPVFIAKYDPSLREEYFNEDNARILSKRLKEIGLKVRSVGSHMDLGQTNSVVVFKKRMDFAKAIGAGIILTNAGHKSREASFHINMKELVLYAEKLDLIIAFENPGDGEGQLLETGLQGLEILDKIGSDRIRLNYDFSNVFTYSKGKRSPDQEIEKLLPYLGHLHLKNVKLLKSHWMVCGIGEGVIDYRRLFQRFPALLSVPMSIELPIGFGYDDQFNFALQKESPVLHEEFAAPSLEYIRHVLSSSFRFCETSLIVGKKEC